MGDLQRIVPAMAAASDRCLGTRLFGQPGRLIGEALDPMADSSRYAYGRQMLSYGHFYDCGLALGAIIEVDGPKSRPGSTSGLSQFRGGSRKSLKPAEAEGLHQGRSANARPLHSRRARCGSP